LDILQLVPLFLAIASISSTIILGMWKHRKDLEKARVSRILQPLRDIEFRSRQLRYGYDKPDYFLDFCVHLDQLNRIIQNDMIQRGLYHDIEKESERIKDNLVQLHGRYSKITEEYHEKQRRIRSDDVASLNRLYDEYRIQLFKDEQVKKLVFQLTDELVEWLKKHS